MTPGLDADGPKNAPTLKDDPDGAPSPPLIIDFHVDLPYFMMSHAKGDDLTTLRVGPFTLEKARSTGVRVFGTALYCEDRFNGESSFERLQEVYRFASSRLRGVGLLRGERDLHAIDGNPSLIGSFFLLENADALAGRPSFVRELRARGIHAVGLTHVGKNRLGDGNGVPDSNGLTGAGVQVVRELEENQLLVDAAHLHPKCFRDLLRIGRGPLITSHTGIRSVCDIPRNIDLDQAKEILLRGGIIGITLNPEMLSSDKRGGLGDVFVHLDTVVQKFGPSGVGIGSDLCGFDPPEGELADVTALAGLIKTLRDHGYSEDHIGGIMGLNWLRLLKNHLPHP